MQREIKFRQFIGGKMVYWGFLDGAFLGPSSNGADAENAQNTPHMQYTGLKDKNGKEIYEGDVCKWPSGINREIVWDGRNACFNSKDVMLMVEIGKITILGHHLEIIGNIYESPELLTN